MGHHYIDNVSQKYTILKYVNLFLSIVDLSIVFWLTSRSQNTEIGSSCPDKRAVQGSFQIFF